MMKTHFIRMFQYDHHVNKLMLRLIGDQEPPQRAVQLMAHVLGAQQVWLARCKKEPAIGGAIWPDWKLEVLPGIADDNASNWTGFVETLTPEAFEQDIHYRNSKNEPFTNRLSDVLAHVVNHGTHHRAQVGQLLKNNGLSGLPVTDYIFFLREQNL